VFVAASWCFVRRGSSQHLGAFGYFDLRRSIDEEQEHPAAATIRVIRVRLASSCEATGPLEQRRRVAAKLADTSPGIRSTNRVP
jgi:hypothetical protein